uniref:Uncharacterized protein n=1 Tax=Utricularia reniformis TaxID=192314 RepID=A0A1Y0B2X3_9LAMI|nr:hypothetical protein AEK19_MT1563 [Utricularia reniformis]ART31750.1 hypothetical protein AEK19_MT1563 [Utricularia reniformis]
MSRLQKEEEHFFVISGLSQLDLFLFSVGSFLTRERTPLYRGRMKRGSGLLSFPGPDMTDWARKNSGGYPTRINYLYFFRDGKGSGEEGFNPSLRA